MTKTLILAAALVAVPTVANAAERTFTRNGVTYTYTSTKQGDRTILTGKSSAGSPYTLVVRGKRVSGTVGATPVSFTIDKPLPSSVETASIY